MARTGAQSNEHSLFPDEQSSQLFPLIPVNLKQFTYLSALLPRDQIFEDDHSNEPDTKDDEKQKKEDEAQTVDNEENRDDPDQKDENDSSVKGDSFNKENDLNDLNDNPFLRPSKICKKRGPKLISFK